MTLVRVPAVGKLGVVKDISPNELPLDAWTDALNVRFLDGAAYQFYGHGEVYNSPTYAPQYIFPVLVGSDNGWIYTTATKQFYVTNSGGAGLHTDITHLTARAGIANEWTGGLLSGIPVVNADDGKAPMYWDLNVTHKFVDVPAWTTGMSCRSLRPYKNYLIALNITKSGTNYPFMIKWSHSADPGTMPNSWDHTDTTKDAGEFDITTGHDEVIDGMTLRDSFIIYKATSAWRMQYSAGSFIFNFAKIFDSVGILAKNCVVEVDGYHVVLTGSDVIAHDGQTANSILDKQTRRYLFEQIDAEQYSKCFLFRNMYMNEVFICFPEVGQTVCTKAMVWNYKDKTVTFRSLPNINHAEQGIVDNGLVSNWSQDGSPWEEDLTLWNNGDFIPATARVLMAGNDIKLFMLDSSASYDGVAPTGYMEKRGISFGAPEAMKYIRSIRPRITGSPGGTVTIKIGASKDPWADPVWKKTLTHTIGQTHANNCLVSGRYIAIRFETGTAYQWRIDSYDVDVAAGGSL